MRHEHLFIIDPLATLNLALDSSLRLMFELVRAGDNVRVCETRELTWTRGETSARVTCHRLKFAGSATQATAVDTEVLRLTDFAALHMRKDPPYDMDYIATTWLLDTAVGSTRVYNDPAALRRYNEKLTILLFPDEMRDALVSSDAKALLAFAQLVGGDLILKPLHLFGGRGIERIQLNDGRDKALATLQRETANGEHLRLAQAFDPKIQEGEVRAFAAFGEPIAWCLKRPAPGQYLANTRMGAQLLKYQPTADENERVKRVAKKLWENGVAFTGFDLIGGWLSEVNLTSPRLLQAAEDSANYYETWAAMIRRDLGN